MRLLYTHTLTHTHTHTGPLFNQCSSLVIDTFIYMHIYTIHIYIYIHLSLSLQELCYRYSQTPRIQPASQPSYTSWFHSHSRRTTLLLLSSFDLEVSRMLTGRGSILHIVTSNISVCFEAIGLPVFARPLNGALHATNSAHSDC